MAASRGLNCLPTSVSTQNGLLLPRELQRAPRKGGFPGLGLVGEQKPALKIRDYRMKGGLVALLIIVFLQVIVKRCYVNSLLCLYAFSHQNRGFVVLVDYVLSVVLVFNASIQCCSNLIIVVKSL